jgi:uncharacterized membrane-anchored protein
MTARFVLACLVQLAIVAALAFVNVAVLAGGTEVLLRIEPVDPRDPLRGDYLTFQYAVSSLDSRLFAPRRPNPGELVYVVLGSAGQYWEARRVDPAPPAAELFLTGRVTSAPAGPEGRVRVVYGIEQYFVAEGRGAAFDPRTRTAAAQVVIDRTGQAVVKQLFVDGRPFP